MQMEHEVFDDKMIKLLESIDPSAIENRWYGAWTTILTQTFPWSQSFIVAPQILALTDTKGAVDNIVMLLIRVHQHPVFLVEIKKADTLKSLAVCKDADKQLRKRFALLMEEVPVPKLFALSAFGTTCCVYHFGKGYCNIEPKLATVKKEVDEKVMLDTAPETNWDLDLLTPSGRTRFLSVCQEVKQMALVVVAEHEKVRDQDRLCSATTRGMTSTYIKDPLTPPRQRLASSKEEGRNNMQENEENQEETLEARFRVMTT